MDFTINNKKLYTTKLINGETVNYCTSFFFVTFLFLIFKQLLKTFCGLGASVAVLVAFIISAVVLFFVEKKFVFNHKSNDNTLKQILLYVFRCVVNFGLYKIVDFLFGHILSRGSPFVFLMTWFIYLFFNYYFDRLLVFDCISKAINNKNGKLYGLFFRNRFILFSGLLALVCISFVFIVFQLFPFGDMTVLRMDLYHQYGPLFAELYDRVVNFDTFLYSWNSGGGSSFLGNYFNYLSSPISALIFLFDRKDISYAITLLVIVKGVLSACTFSYYLKSSLNRHSYVTSAFGVMYAFCGYFLAYYWNIMWIDGMILLPLITLGIERIINKGNAKLYIASLTVLFFSTYYMGYMCCIFSVLYFFVYFFINNNGNEKINPLYMPKNKYSLKSVYNLKLINRGVRFAIASITSGLLCACTLIPVYFILQSCSATSDTFPVSFESYFNVIDMLTSHLAALETTIRSSGEDVLPNIYCGILTVLLVPLYFVNKDIKLKEKGIYVLLLAFFVFSFNNNVMNFIWHAFHFPNDLPYRFSYIYSFIILVMSFKALMHFKSIRYQDIMLVGMFWCVLILIFQKDPTAKMSELCIYVSLALVIVWTGALAMAKKGTLNKFVIGITIVALTFCETIIADTNSYEFTQFQSDYVSNYDSYQDAIKHTYNKDKGFYRTELTYLDTRMDPSLYGYRGMSIFSSMAYEDYSQNQYSLGMFGNRINSYTYNTQTPIYNMMYSIKYVMQKDSSVKPSKDFYTYSYQTKDKDTVVYRNDYFLPIAFEASSDIKNWDNEEGNPFDVQNDFLTKATGVGSAYIPCEYVGTEYDSIDCEDVTENGTYYFSKFDSESTTGTVDITIKATTNSNVYVYLTSPGIENVNYSWNNDNNSTYQNINEPYIMDLGMHNKGDEILISIDCGSIESDSSYFDIYAYSIDKSVVESAYDMLNASSLQITSHSDTDIKGTVEAGYDGYLYTSIPYDEGWSVYIDGQKAKTFKVGGCQLATTIKAGKYEVRLKYTPKGLLYGLVISGTAWLVIIALAIINKRSKNDDSIKIC